MAEKENLSPENFPRRLSAEEISNPCLAVVEFFTFNNLSECREELRNWFYAALSAESVAETGNPANLFSFYERVEKLIEAAHVMKEAQIDSTH